MLAYHPPYVVVYISQCILMWPVAPQVKLLLDLK